jgi:RNA recognition motif-containing protein
LRIEDKGRLLYVGNLSWTCRWQDVKDFFTKYGEVIRVDIAYVTEKENEESFFRMSMEGREGSVRFYLIKKKMLKLLLVRPSIVMFFW